MSERSIYDTSYDKAQYLFSQFIGGRAGLTVQRMYGHIPSEPKATAELLEALARVMRAEHVRREEERKKKDAKPKAAPTSGK